MPHMGDRAIACAFWAFGLSWPAGAYAQCSTSDFDMNGVPDVCPAGSNYIEGTAAGETLRGTNGADCIFGLGGDDDITGRSGDDYICAGTGADVVNGCGGSKPAKLRVWLESSPRRPMERCTAAPISCAMNRCRTRRSNTCLRSELRQGEASVTGRSSGLWIRHRRVIRLDGGWGTRVASRGRSRFDGFAANGLWGRRPRYRKRAEIPSMPSSSSSTFRA